MLPWTPRSAMHTGWLALQALQPGWPALCGRQNTYQLNLALQTLVTAQTLRLARPPYGSSCGICYNLVLFKTACTTSQAAYWNKSFSKGRAGRRRWQTGSHKTAYLASTISKLSTAHTPNTHGSLNISDHEQDRSECASASRRRPRIQSEFLGENGWLSIETFSPDCSLLRADSRAC